MLIVFTSINPAFLSLTNISNALTFTVELGLIALAMTLLMTAGEFDLSVGSRLRVHAGRHVGAVQRRHHAAISGFSLSHWWWHCAIGFVSGLFVTRLGIPSFLVTLGMLLVVRGSALWLTSGFPQRTWDADNQWLATLLVGDFYIGGLRIYMSLIWFILIAIVFHVHSDPDAVRQLDSGNRRQRQCCPESRRADQACQTASVHALLGDGRICRGHLFDPGLCGQSQFGHGLRA